MTNPAEKLWYFPISRNAIKVCTANSLVGEITTAPSPSIGPHLRRYNRSRRGMRKAKVLPEPVLALPRTSRPRRDGGIPSDWIGVGETKWLDLRPLRVRDERGSWSKVMMSCLISWSQPDRRVNSQNSQSVFASL